MRDGADAKRVRWTRRWALQLFVLLALVWIGRPCAAGQQDKVLRVFLFMGQSNMVGADSRVEDIRLYPPFAGLEQPQKAVKFAYCIGRENKAQSDGWTELQPVEGMVGPELSFARRVTQHIDAPIAIIACCAICCFCWKLLEFLRK